MFWFACHFKEYLTVLDSMLWTKYILTFLLLPIIEQSHNQLLFFFFFPGGLLSSIFLFCPTNRNKNLSYLTTELFKIFGCQLTSFTQCIKFLPILPSAMLYCHKFRWCLINSVKGNIRAFYATATDFLEIRWQMQMTFGSPALLSSPNLLRNYPPLLLPVLK